MVNSLTPQAVQCMGVAPISLMVCKTCWTECIAGKWTSMESPYQSSATLRPTGCERDRCLAFRFAPRASQIILLRIRKSLLAKIGCALARGNALVIFTARNMLRLEAAKGWDKEGQETGCRDYIKCNRLLK